jgi:HK97 gp10 family phage protein
MSRLKVHSTGFDAVMADLQDKLGDAGARKSADAALRAGAAPMREQILSNIDTGGHVRTGQLRGAISIGKLTGGKKGFRMKVGVIGNGAPYAHFVEYGHGGPRPAPPHPFMAPAYEATKGRAMELAAQALREALDL